MKISNVLCLFLIVITFCVCVYVCVCICFVFCFFVICLPSEIWGVYAKCDSDFKAWDNTPVKKTHLKFCKCYLEISNRASNVVSRSELGRFPLIVNILRYILYLLVENDGTLRSSCELAETCPSVPDRIGIWRCWLRRGEIRGTRRKTSRSKAENPQ